MSKRKRPPTGPKGTGKKWPLTPADTENPLWPNFVDWWKRSYLGADCDMPEPPVRDGHLQGCLIGAYWEAFLAGVVAAHNHQRKQNERTNPP